MATGIVSWSKTAATNNTADSAVNWQEGQAPSSVNDSARGMMAATAKWRDDLNGTITSTGTAGAYAVSTNQSFASLTNGYEVAFIAHATNTAAPTLSVDSLTAKPIRSAAGTEIPAGVLVAGTPYRATYYSTNGGEWVLHGFYGSPYLIPIAGGLDYWGATVPNSSFAFPVGQAISRATYATLFDIIGTTHGSGDGSTTFNLPDKTGRVSAMKESSATRLTSTYFGGNSTALGATGGSASKTLLTANLPPYTPAGSVALTPVVNASGVQVSSISLVVGSGVNHTWMFNDATFGTVNSGTFAGTAQGGTSTPVATVQPTIVCNYIMRII